MPEPPAHHRECRLAAHKLRREFGSPQAKPEVRDAYGLVHIEKGAPMSASLAVGLSALARPRAGVARRPVEMRLGRHSRPRSPPHQRARRI